MKFRQISNQQNVRNVLSFLNLGFKDYIAARVLLNSGLLLQGATLASTSVEKYFKAIMALRGDYSEGHLKKAHLNSVKNYDPKFYISLNESFLLFLQKCYRLRYFDDIEAGFSLAVIQRPTLAELDYTISSIHKRFTLKRGEETLTTMYDAALNEKNADLFLDNYILNNIDKGTFIQQKESSVYAMRLDDVHGLIEANYIAVKGSHDGNFLIEGLTPKT